MLEALDWSHLIAVFIGAVPGLIAMVLVARIKSGPEMVSATAQTQAAATKQIEVDTDRMTKMWKRIEHLEAVVEDQRRDFAAALEKERVDCDQKLSQLREEMGALMYRVEQSEAEEYHE